MNVILRTWCVANGGGGCIAKPLKGGGGGYFELLSCACGENQISGRAVNHTRRCSNMIYDCSESMCSWPSLSSYSVHRSGRCADAVVVWRCFSFLLHVIRTDHVMGCRHTQPFKHVARHARQVPKGTTLFPGRKTKTRTSTRVNERTRWLVVPGVMRKKHQLPPGIGVLGSPTGMIQEIDTRVGRRVNMDHRHTCWHLRCDLGVLPCREQAHTC